MNEYFRISLIYLLSCLMTSQLCRIEGHESLLRRIIFKTKYVKFQHKIVISIISVEI